MRERITGLLLLMAAIPGLAHTFGEDGIFAYVTNDKGQAAHRNVEGYKYEVALEVFNRLAQARGDFRQPPPDFVMNDGRQYIAWMNPKKKQIGLEAAAYDICTTFGADSLNAMAALLAHEMTHYYEKHDWTRHFTNANPGMEATQKMGQMADGLKLETQADYLGGFLALSAGYDIYGIIPELLPKLYRAYLLPDQLPRYPVLSERVGIARNAMERVAQLDVAFQTAGCLTVAGAYEPARDYYSYILKDYQSRELYNNLGVLDVLAALEYFGPEEMPYILPLEMDADSRLNRSSRSVDSIAYRGQLLNDALAQFERAALLDDNYPAALLNKACAYLLLGETEDADYWARKAKRLSQRLKREQEQADADILLGILAAMEGETDEAAGIFGKAAAAGRRIGQANLDALTGTTSSAPAVLGFAAASETGVERIDGLLLDDFMAAPALSLQVEVAKGVYCGLKQWPHSMALVHYIDDNHYAYFLSTTETYEGTTRKGIKLGDDLETLQEHYTGYHKIVASRQGDFLVYPLEKVIFLIGPDGRLKRWMAYRMKLGPEG
ncbi:MAG: hypothetical protein KDC66_06425 [Phaeodactylibacter sp.]|nr:hypothetical protein [Phaeodactylibacter sp.]MCB9277174.1 hypothetical protein [Lewinellaceae bacterium]